LPKLNTKRSNPMTPEAKPAIAVKRTLHLEVPVEKAFQVFTEKWAAGGRPLITLVELRSRRS
jgi:hypothetical protein